MAAQEEIKATEMQMCAAVSLPTKGQLVLVTWEHEHAKYCCQNTIAPFLVVTRHTCRDKSLCRLRLEWLRGKQGCSWPRPLWPHLQREHMSQWNIRVVVKFLWCQSLFEPIGEPKSISGWQLVMFFQWDLFCHTNNRAPTMQNPSSLTRSCSPTSSLKVD